MSDAEHVNRAIQNDPAAFEALLVRYQPLVESVVLGYLDRREDVQDAVQETFLSAYVALPSLRDARRFGPWLLAIARNMALNWGKSESRRREVGLDAAALERLASAPAAGLAEQVELALDEMQPRMRQLLLLHYFDETSLSDIAELLICPEGTVKRQLFEARVQLKHVLVKAGMKVRLSDDALNLRRKIMNSAPVVKFANVLLMTAAAENASLITLDPKNGSIRMARRGHADLDIPPAEMPLCHATCERLLLLGGNGRTVSLSIGGKSYAITVRQEPNAPMTVEMQASAD